jgi:hypothetical protein
MYNLLSTVGITPFEWTTELLAPITGAINQAMGVVVPIGIGVMGIFIGVSVVKRVIFTFL